MVSFGKAAALAIDRDLVPAGFSLARFTSTPTFVAAVRRAARDVALYVPLARDASTRAIERMRGRASSLSMKTSM